MNPATATEFVAEGEIATHFGAADPAVADATVGAALADQIKTSPETLLTMTRGTAEALAGVEPSTGRSDLVNPMQFLGLELKRCQHR